MVEKSNNSPISRSSSGTFVWTNGSMGDVGRPIVRVILESGSIARQIRGHPQIQHGKLIWDSLSELESFILYPFPGSKDECASRLSVFFFRRVKKKLCLCRFRVPSVFRYVDGHDQQIKTDCDTHKLLFAQLGCAGCHVQTTVLLIGASWILEFWLVDTWTNENSSFVGVIWSVALASHWSSIGNARFTTSSWTAHIDSFHYVLRRSAEIGQKFPARHLHLLGCGNSPWHKEKDAADCWSRSQKKKGG